MSEPGPGDDERKGEDARGSELERLDRLELLDRRIAAFNAERSWGPFHTPRDLAMALSIESSELLELFLWKREGEVPARERLEEELGDVVICMLNLARRLGIDPIAAATAKLGKNAVKYPVAAARGRATKWDELEAATDERTEGEDDGAHPAR